MVVTNPHVKSWIQFIIMKIFMKIVQICPKSPRFTVPYHNLKSNFSKFFKFVDLYLQNTVMSYFPQNYFK